MEKMRSLWGEINFISSIVLVIFLVSAGCSEDSSNGMTDHDHDSHDHGVVELKGIVSKHTTNQMFMLKLDFGVKLVKGMNSFTLTLMNHDGKAVSGAQIEVIPFMTAHNHGSSAKPVVTTQGGGKYLVENVVFQMMGEWDMTIKVSQGKMSDELKLTFSIK